MLDTPTTPPKATKGNTGMSLLDEIEAATPEAAPGFRCSSCRAIATLTDDERTELVAIFAGTTPDPRTNQPMADHKVATWLSKRSGTPVNRWTVRDCRADHYGIRRRP